MEKANLAETYFSILSMDLGIVFEEINSSLHKLATYTGYLNNLCGPGSVFVILA